MSSAVAGFALPSTMRSFPGCSTTYIVPGVPTAPGRNTIATGLDSPVTTDDSPRLIAASAPRVGAIVGTVVEAGEEPAVPAPVVGVVGVAGEVGAVDGTGFGVLLLHAVSATDNATAAAIGNPVRTRIRGG